MTRAKWIDKKIINQKYLHQKERNQIVNYKLPLHGNHYIKGKE